MVGGHFMSFPDPSVSALPGLGRFSYWLTILHKCSTALMMSIIFASTYTPVQYHSILSLNIIQYHSIVNGHVHFIWDAKP